ncbi:MAG: hypothetical protein ACFFCX_18085, partial [Candidatus Sifarchaeia archaeon]
EIELLFRGENPTSYQVLHLDTSSFSEKDAKWYDRSSGNNDGVLIGNTCVRDANPYESVRPVWDRVHLSLSVDRTNLALGEYAYFTLSDFYYEFDGLEPEATSTTVWIQRDSTPNWKQVTNFVFSDMFFTSDVEVSYTPNDILLSGDLFGIDTFTSNILYIHWDDDVSAPHFANLYYQDTGEDYVLYAEITDTSGVDESSIVFEYRIPGSSAFVTATGQISRNGDVWFTSIGYETSTMHDTSLEWRVYANDCDDDCIGDEKGGWSGSVSIRLNPLGELNPYTKRLGIGEVAVYTTYFNVYQDAIYHLSLIHTAAITNISIWLDGYWIYNGVNIWLSCETSHSITVYLESADTNAAWALRLMNMKNTIDSEDGQLFFNTFAPAPATKDMLMEFLGLIGISAKDEYPGTFTSNGALRSGSFEADTWSYWDTDEVNPASRTTSQAYDGSWSIQLQGSHTSSTSSSESFNTFLPSGWSEVAYNGRTDWEGYQNQARIRGDEIYSGSGSLVSTTYDTSNANSSVYWEAYIWTTDWDFEGTLKIYVKNQNGAWDLIKTITNPNQYPHKESWSSTISSYRHSNFAVKYEAYGLTDGTDNLYLDDHKITMTTLYNKRPTFIEYDSTEETATTEVGFYYKRIGTNIQEHKITILLDGGTQVVETFVIVDTTGWEKFCYIIDSSRRFVSIKIETIRIESGSDSTYIDFVYTKRAYGEAAQWSNDMKSNLHVENVVGYDLGSTWECNITYAAHSEFIAYENAEALLCITVGSSIGGATIMVYSDDVNVYNVTQSTDLNWLTETVAHEWVHNYLTLRPLGINFMTSPELRTMNETTAAIAGKEIGRVVIEHYYLELVPPPPPPQPEISSIQLEQESQPQFDFRAEMRETREITDQLLAEGKIETAEIYMELRR